MAWSVYPISALVTRSALQRPVTRLYPFEKREPYARTRGHIGFSITDCDFCTICAAKCPTDAIVVGRKEKTWAIDHARCILCGNCVDDCKTSCLSLSTSPWPAMTSEDMSVFREEYSAPREAEHAE